MASQRGRLMVLASVGLGFVVLAGSVYGAALGWLWFQQEKLLFAPTVLPAGLPLATAGDIHETWVDVPGARLSALHLRLPDPRAWCSSCTETAAVWRTGSSARISTGAPISTCS